MNILFMLDYYSPNASANGVCVEKIVENYTKRGDKVSILSFGNANDEIEMNGVSRYYCCKDAQDKVKMNPFVFYMKWFLPSRNPIYQRKQVVKELVKKAKDIICQNKIDTVVCVHLPVETLLAGVLLKKYFLNVRFVAYMLDSLSGGFNPRYFFNGYFRSRKIIWENRIFDEFDQIILMKSSKNHYEKYCANRRRNKKIFFLDIPLFAPKAVKDVDEKREVKKLAFVGTMAENIRTPYHFLKILNEICFPVEFVVAGKNSCDRFEKYCQSEYVNIISCGLLPHSEAETIIEQAEVLVSFGNKNSALVPSKIFEYMSIGKPIIATYCSSDDASIGYLCKYPKVLLFDEGNKNYQLQAKQLESFLNNADRQTIDLSKLDSVFEDNKPETFCRLIADIGFQGRKE